MATQSQYLGLSEPAPTDPVDIDIIDNDLNILDSTIHTDQTNASAETTNRESADTNLQNQVTTLQNTVEVKANKGVASGYAGLDAAGLVPTAQSRVVSVDGLTGQVSLSGEYFPKNGLQSLAQYNETLSSQTQSTSAAIDLSLAREFNITLTGTVALTFANVPTLAGVRISIGLALVQDATGGRTVTWPSSVDWGIAGVPSLSTVGGKTDYFTFVTDNNGTTWWGFLGAKGF